MFLGLLDPVQNKLEKTYLLLASWKSLAKRAEYGVRSVNQVCGFKDPDPDPYQNDGSAAFRIRLAFHVGLDPSFDMTQKSKIFTAFLFSDKFFSFLS